MKQLLIDIRNCEVCTAYLPLGPRPVVAAHSDARIAIIGQAPGKKVHHSGVPWDDPSGIRLREWLGVTDEQFYDHQFMALIPMGFCYPGKGTSGDLPPRAECAPLWHEGLLKKMPELRLVLLIGTYAQNYYLKGETKANLTETVRSFHHYLPRFFPLPHPSPRNRFWFGNNPWFQSDVLPVLKQKTRELLD